jgi:hypothetical protein
LAGALAADEPAMRPMPVDWTSKPDSPASVSFLLQPPAGKDGFLKVAGGHLVRPGGSRFRIWGVNVTGKACVPPKEHAPLVAAHLARCGVNCVRFHFLDLLAPAGLVDRQRDDTRSLDAAQLDRLDFFVTQLKSQGIYTNLNLNVGRTYKAGDQVRDHELLGFAKALTYFDPRLIELQKEYARALLTHRNPYTNREYRDEPAVAIVELVNENSIVESWFSGRLLGQNQRKDPGIWIDIPASYEKSLTELYSQWLGEQLAAEAMASLRSAVGVQQGPIPRLRPAEFAKAPKERFHAEAAFYMDLERRYFQDMARYLREELKVKSLLVATSDHNHGKSGYPLLASASQLDIVDGHVYWQHPNYLTEPATGRHKGFTIPNTPMVNDPWHSSVVQLSRTAMEGKPYTVSEVNHPFPNEYACEGIPILAAYAALQDWDGIFWYTLAHDDVASSGTRAIGHFDLAPDPVKMTQLAAGALVFLRPDVRPAKRSIPRSYSLEQVVESLRLPHSEWPYFTLGFPLSSPLIHGTRITSLQGPATGQWENIGAGPIRSDTGEILWQGQEARQGMVVVDTDRSQALIGFCKANQAQTKNLTAQVENTFCSLTLSTLDDQRIPQSGKLLLTATARVANSGMQWNEGRTALEQWGKGPACIENVTGSIVLRGLEGVSEVTARPLDGAGHPQGPVVHTDRFEGGWRLGLGGCPATWYLVTVSRPGTLDRQSGSTSATTISPGRVSPADASGRGQTGTYYFRGRRE